MERKKEIRFLKKGKSFFTLSHLASASHRSYFSKSFPPKHASIKNFWKYWVICFPEFLNLVVGAIICYLLFFCCQFSTPTYSISMRRRFLWNNPPPPHPPQFSKFNYEEKKRDVTEVRQGNRKSTFVDLVKCLKQWNNETTKQWSNDKQNKAVKVNLNNSLAVAPAHSISISLRH